MQRLVLQSQSREFGRVSSGVRERYFRARCPLVYSVLGSRGLVSLFVPFSHNIVFWQGLFMFMALLWRLLGRALCCWGLFGQVLPVAAEVYRSVDAQGRVVYTDRPPPGEQRPPVSSAQKSEAAREGRQGTDWAEQERGFRARSMDRSASEAKEQAARSDRCARARTRESRLASADGISLYREGQGGAREYISDAERGELARRTRQDIESNCRR